MPLTLLTTQKSFFFEICFHNFQRLTAVDAVDSVDTVDNTEVLFLKYASKMFKDSAVDAVDTVDNMDI